MSIIPIIIQQQYISKSGGYIPPDPPDLEYPQRIYKNNGEFIGVAYDDAGVDQLAILNGVSTNSLLRKLNKTLIGSKTDISSFGDSITFGDNATPVTNGYAYLLANNKSKIAHNYGVRSCGAFVANQKAFENLSAVNNQHILTWMNGLNEISRNYYDQYSNIELSYEMVKCGLRAFITNNILSTAIPASSNDIIKIGTWTSSNLYNTHGAKSSFIAGQSILNNTLNSELNYSFTGSNIVIGTFGSSGEFGADYGSFEVYVDDVLKTTYICNGKSDGNAYLSYDNVNYTNDFIQDAIIIKNLTSGNHSLRIKNITNKTIAIDYIGAVKTAINSSPLIIGEMPFTFPLPQEIRDRSRQDLVSVIDEFIDYPIALAQCRDAYNNGFYLTDNVHPNSAGHQELMIPFSTCLE